LTREDSAMAGEFCVVCGRSDVPLVDGVCADCYAKQHTLVRAPEQALVVICPTCGSRQVRRHWEREGAPPNLSSEDLAPLLEILPEVGLRRTRWTETMAGETVRRLEGEADVLFRGTERTVPLSLTVRIESRTCPTCSRRSGNYYTAIIQLRGPEERRRPPATVLRTQIADAYDRIATDFRADWRKAITRREALPEGWNLYLTDTLAARGIARMIKSRTGGDLKESATLWGRRKGQDVYRVTFRLRLPLPAASPASA
jgi:60S ribosomal export protein NMD3